MDGTEHAVFNVIQLYLDVFKPLRQSLIKVTFV